MVSTHDDGFSNRGCRSAFFFSLFDVWVCFNGLIGVMTMGMGLVWVSIFFDLLMSVEMGFQPWCL